MSCLMLSPDRFQRIANTLLLPLPSRYCDRGPMGFLFREPAIRSAPYLDEYAHISAMVRDWFNANRLAYESRYKHLGEKVEDEGWPFAPQAFASEVLTPVQLFKTLECLAYQLAEDVPKEQEQRHEAIRAEVERAADRLARAIVSMSDEYDAAEWG